ncbi:MAG: helix-turn-helix domain-containing protein [Actinomycetota bacterium]|nr:helix-turn-helix domain-containing protein [Actinomycetota bacterium]
MRVLDSQSASSVHEGGFLIKEARKRAGLSQRRLAERLATSQSVVARWESGARSPSMETVTRALRACGFDFDVLLMPVDQQDLAMAAQNVRLTPAERLESLENIFDIEAWAERVRVANRDSG